MANREELKEKMTLTQHLLLYITIHLTIFALLKLASHYPYEAITLLSYLAL